MIFCQQLYEKIILENGKQSDKLLVLSGYSSSDFLEKVTHDLPNLNIELIIGMAMQGIRYTDNKTYKKYTRDESKPLRINYRVIKPPDHQKVLCFIKNDKLFKCFIGSANFSDSGYFDQVETMTLVEDTFGIDMLIKKAREGSVSCLDENSVPLIDDSVTDEQSGNEELPSPSKINSLNTKDNKEDNKLNKDDTENLSKLGDSFNEKEYTLILKQSRNSRWASQGINSFLEGKKQYISVLRHDYDKHFFPDDRLITLINQEDHGKKFHAKRTGSFKKFLEFEDLDIYSEASKRLGLKERLPLSNAMLRSVNMEKIVFKKIDENEFLFYFR